MVSTRVSQGSFEELRQALETLVDGLPPEAAADLADAVCGFVTAIDYKDDALLRSRYEAMGAAFADTADRSIERTADWVRRTREVCREVKSLNGRPDEKFDEVGRACQVLFDRLAQVLASLKRGWARLAQECGHEVSQADELESLIRDVAALRDSTLTGWPWTSLGLPQVNRTMVAESRAAYARGEGRPIEDWIREEASRPSNG